MKTLITLLAGAALAASTVPALAQEADGGAMPGMDHSGMDMPAGTATQAYMEAMDVMMSGMSAVTYTGDADADFLLMMIPHHQSAVDMSRALLEETDDAEVEALAQAVIATQEAEIATMRAMLERMGIEAPPAPAE
ncbi:DUF305 domain-containing protein [Jannaschia rubra]|uniref:DUF305 domain-containing protein n=1 Tax=Jannaschia rubra TaxID=282197 RepID=A0A0M6XTN2_9RHOB|nr:DUF305 domain-containing protein [Jannaschia rubra]CTQ34529.1 hypothetical protein JAN5088_03325 [Jannaschia rubra]